MAKTNVNASDAKRTRSKAVGAAAHIDPPVTPTGVTLHTVPPTAAVTQPEMRPYPHIERPDGIAAVMTPDRIAFALDLQDAYVHDWPDELSGLALGLSREWPFREEVSLLVRNLQDAASDRETGRSDDQQFSRDQEHYCALFATIFLRVGFYIGASFMRSGYEKG